MDEDLKPLRLTRWINEMPTRFVVFDDEDENYIPLSKEIIKQFRGNDFYYCRQLHNSNLPPPTCD